MFEALSRVLESLQFGPYERKVKKYLEDANQDSVLKDLTKALGPKIRELRNLLATFDTFCLESDDQEKYWNEQCFANFVSSTHPNLTNNESEIQLLWGCFEFHACHPFPAIATNNKIDFSAFTRAAALLAVQGTDLLGTQDEGDILWRQNEADSRQADFRRMFRAIGQEKENLSEELEDHDGTTSAVEDVMDVLAMTQPFSIGVLPSPDQLEPTARNLLANFPDPWRRQVTRRALSTLISLILRLRLGQGKWGSQFHYGYIAKGEPADGALADILINTLGEDQGEGLSDQQVSTAMDLFPNLRLQFYQLWTVLFQPPMPRHFQLPNHKPAIISPPILRAISLFIPPTELPGSSQHGSKDKIVMFHVLSESPQSSGDLTRTRLAEALMKDSRPHLIIITKQTIEDDPATVMGAYCPNTLLPSPKDLSLTPPLLFQLTPEFHLASWTNPPKPLTGFIHGDDDNDTIAKNSKPYWIGACNRKGPCLSIDPATKSATLTSTPMETDLRISTGLEPVDAMAWESTVQPVRLEVFSVEFG